jgi:DNA/RNA-binding domain of Phe-tRNA-synthetase-like protein
MNLTVTPAVQELFPDMIIGLVSGVIEQVRPDAEGQILAMRESAMDNLRSKFPSTEELGQHPHIRAWRDAYQKFGVKAKDHKPTHEALTRRLINQGVWPTINPLVDVYLTNQVDHILPHGGYDTDTLTGSIALVSCQQPEPFHPLGGGEELTNRGELVYRDDARVLTRRWNHRDCDATKLTDKTKSFLLFIESPGKEIPESVIEKAAQDLVERYKRCFQGTFNWSISSNRDHCLVG